METPEKTGRDASGVVAGAVPLRSARKVSPTEFAEAFISGIKRAQTTGTFLVTYRGGRPIRIREVNELTQS